MMKILIKCYSYDHIILADIEHQKSITSNLLEISQKINDDCRS